MEKERKIKASIPQYLIRQGYLIILLCAGILFALIYFIEFKETINGEIIITSEVMPQDIITRQSGKLNLLKREGETVERGQIVAFIESDARLQDVVQLKKNVLNSDFTKVVNDYGLQLGVVSSSLQQLNESIREQQLFLRTDQTNALVASKDREINLLHQRIQLLTEQHDLLKKDKDLSESRKLIDEELRQDSIISQRELELSVEKFLGKSFTEIDTRGSINEFQVQIERLEQEKIDLKMKYQTTKAALQTAVLNEKEELLDAIEQWEQKYILRSEIEGVCVLNDLMTDKEFIEQGVKVMTITPNQAGETLGIMQLPTYNSSKVKVGFPVNVRFDNYPFREFGIVKGEIQSIAGIPNDSRRYNVRIIFPEGVSSTYGIDFSFRQLMSGNAEIVTGRYSILERAWQQLKSKQLNE